MRRVVVAIALAAALVLLGLWLVDRRHGTALTTDGAMLSFHHPAGPGTRDVHFLAPALESRVDGPLRIKAVHLDQADAGWELADIRIYQRDDFPAGIPVSWTPGGPLQPMIASTSLIDHELAAREKAEVLFVHLRITSTRRPLTASGLRVTYRHGFRDHTQLIPIEYRLTHSPNGGSPAG